MPAETIRSERSALDVLSEARWLMRFGACSAECLLSGSRDCACRCGGAYHALLMVDGLVAMGEGVSVADILVDDCPACHGGTRPWRVTREGEASYQCVDAAWSCSWSLMGILEVDGLRPADVTGLPPPHGASYFYENRGHR